ncbi:MAG: hypothetical protein O7I42_01995 [Alphaproteobacteria bacterium]|nr:hypothetical protein [Alphaproteobacteria bacterium]
MEKNLEPIAKGPSRAVDESRRGGTDLEESQNQASCTINPSEMPERVARWRTLFGHALGYLLTPSEAVFKFKNTTDLKSELGELVKLERICCAHVSWNLDETPHGLTLTLKADAKSLESFVSAFAPALSLAAVTEVGR